MHSRSPTPEGYRYQVQSRVQSLISGQRPRDPALSKLSTRRLIFESIIEELRIYRLYKEEKARKARDGIKRSHSMPDRGSKVAEDCGRQRNGGSERLRAAEEAAHDTSSHRRKVGEARDRSQAKQSARNHSSDTVRHSDPDERFYMTGGAGPPSVIVSGPHTPSTHSSPTKRSRPKRNEDRMPLKQRFNSGGKPLVRGERGWKDAPIGPPPKSKPKLGPMMGLGSHIKEKFRWGVDMYELEQEKKERRARGSLTERKQKRREDKERSKKDREEHTRGRSLKPNDESGVHRGLSRHSHSHYSSSFDANLEAENNARSRGERLARKEARSRNASISQTRETSQLYANHAPICRTQQDDTYLERSRSPHRQHPPSPVYEPNPHSLEVEAIEQAEAEHKADARKSTVNSTDVRIPSTHRDDDVVSNVDDKARNPSLRTESPTDTHWWSDSSAEPSSGDDGSKEGVERNRAPRSPLVELSTGNVLPRDDEPHWPEVGGGQVSNDAGTPLIDPSTTTPTHSRHRTVADSSTTEARHRRDSIDGADIFGTLSAHMNDRR